jgi:transcriptional regulator with XRE-family HTH domain
MSFMIHVSPFAALDQLSPDGEFMVTLSNQSSTEATELGQRLKDLRKRHRLTQEQLASVLSTEESVGGTTISSWENPSADRLPPLERLAIYARLFCTSRSFASGGPRLLQDDELSIDEREAEAALYAELRTLREQVQSPTPGPAASKRPGSIWSFPNGGPVSIVCSGAKPEEQPPYAHPTHLNYTHTHALPI